MNNNIKEIINNIDDYNTIKDRIAELKKEVKSTKDIISKLETFETSDYTNNAIDELRKLLETDENALVDYNDRIAEMVENIENAYDSADDYIEMLHMEAKNSFRIMIDNATDDLHNGCSVDRFNELIEKANSWYMNRTETIKAFAKFNTTAFAMMVNYGYTEV